jgi:replication factor C subunit 1
MIGSRYPIETAAKWLREWATQSKKSLLISGPVGCGKSLLARLICAEAKLPDVVEINASKSRTKKAMQEMEETFKSNTIRSYFRDSLNRGRPGCLIADEVDACDQGGLAQLVAFIKKARIPVVCTCAEGYKKQLAPLQSLSLQVRMSRPSPEQIAPLLSYIAFDQKFSHNFLQQRSRGLAAACNCDVRQSVMELQFLSHSLKSATGGAKLALETTADGVTCDHELGIFDAVSRLFPSREKDPTPGPEEADRLHSADRSLISALVAENYVNLRRLSMDDAAKIADSVSLGDVLERRLPGDVQSVYSVAFPAFMGKRMGGLAQSKFPAFFGNASKANSSCKEARVAAKRYSKISVTAHELLPSLYACLAGPALVHASPQVHAAIAAKLKKMNLGDRASWESICHVGRVREPPADERAKLGAVGKLLVAPARSKKRRAAEDGENEEEEEEDETPKPKPKRKKL